MPPLYPKLLEPGCVGAYFYIAWSWENTHIRVKALFIHLFHFVFIQLYECVSLLRLKEHYVYW